MNTPEHLAALGILADPTFTGRERYTHKATGAAVVRQPWMREGDWIMAVSRFAAQIEENALCDLEQTHSFSLGSSGVAKTMKNQQTAGPVEVAHSPIYGTPFIVSPSGKLSLSGNIGPTDIAISEANARLFAAAYTSFDKAGRELDIDAAELAEKLDVAKLIIAARDALTYLDQRPDAPSGTMAEVAQCGVRYQLRQALLSIRA